MKVNGKDWLGPALRNTGHDCDGLLRSELVFQRGASTAIGMNQVRAQIQAHRKECASEVWNPEIDDGVDGIHGLNGCFASGQATGRTASVGTQVVPAELRDNSNIEGAVRGRSGRDAENNIIVYWGNEANRPADNAACWLYVSRITAWSENH